MGESFSMQLRLVELLLIDCCRNSRATLKAKFSEPINLCSTKITKKNRFSDFRGNKSQLTHLNVLKARREIWRQYQT